MIHSDEFIALGQKVDVFANAAKAFTTTDRAVQKTRRRKAKIAVNKGSQLGPRLTISAQCLGFEALVGERVDQGIDMMNSGSTCIYYEWQRAPTSAGFGATASGDAAAQFFASSACGCILPGAHVDMRFTFQP